MKRPIRILVFPERTDCLLVFVPEMNTLRLPVLQTPFTKEDVAAACKAANIDARISESTPGRWSASMLKARRDDRAEASQRERAREAASATYAIACPTAPPFDKARAAILLRKQETDEQLRKLTAELMAARARAYKQNEYLPPQVYRQKQLLLDKLKTESQGFQAQLGKIREQEKADNRRVHENKKIAAIFVETAAALLPQEVLDEIWAEVDARTELKTALPTQGE